MVEIRHLENAPITEALIDFRIKNSNIESLEKSLELLKERIGVRYPQVNARRGFEAAVQFKVGGVAEQRAGDTGFKGYVFASEDGRNLAQFRDDGFTYNRLKPYTSWGQLLPEAIDLWKLYVEAAKPEYVVRVALRYINHFSLPLPVEDISNYLTGLPNAPEGTSYYLSGFLTRVMMVDPELNLQAAVTQALELNIAQPNSAGVILDIDTSKQKEFNPQDGDILETLEALHKMKNDIFFGSITEDTLRLFNGS
jgi:uncharacterized protein (TIGR04255 family)